MIFLPFYFKKGHFALTASHEEHEKPFEGMQRTARTFHSDRLGVVFNTVANLPETHYVKRGDLTSELSRFPDGTIMMVGLIFDSITSEESRFFFLGGGGA